ncbi:MAG: hypothetical protein PUB70_04675 [Bacteroidales bacterium]|nr:hypothetical protein [Bacteroidales bacterium]
MPPSWHPVSACSPRLCCRRTILLCSYDGAAAIPKSGLEIQNHCTLEDISGQNMQRFPSLPPQIKNHCRIEVVSG